MRLFQKLGRVILLSSPGIRSINPSLLRSVSIVSFRRFSSLSPAVADLHAKMKECFEDSDIAHAERLMQQAFREGRVEANKATYMLLIEEFGKNGFGEDAERVLKSMVRAGFAKEREAYDAVIRAYSVCDPTDPDAAVRVFKAMERAQIHPNITSVSLIIQSLLNSDPPQIEDAEEWLELALEENLNPPPELFSSVLSSYASASGTVVPDEGTHHPPFHPPENDDDYHPHIHIHGPHKVAPERAEALLDMMRETLGIDAPKAKDYAAAIFAFINAGTAAANVPRVFAKMTADQEAKKKKRELEESNNNNNQKEVEDGISIQLYNALLKALQQNGTTREDWQHAVSEIFNAIPIEKRDEKTYVYALGLLRKLKDGAGIEKVLSDARQKHSPWPNSQIYRAAILGATSAKEREKFEKWQMEDNLHNVRRA